MKNSDLRSTRSASEFVQIRPEKYSAQWYDRFTNHRYRSRFVPVGQLAETTLNKLKLKRRLDQIAAILFWSVLINLLLATCVVDGVLRYSQ